MIPSSAALKAWKNAEARASPLAILYDIEIDDTTTLYLVEGDPSGTGSVSFGGHTYLATSISRQEQEQNIEGDLGTFVIAVSNVTGVAGGYIERNELDGRKVTITQIPLSTVLAGTPGTTDKVVEVYTIQDQSYTRMQASITVGPPNFFRRKIPWRKFQRMRCQWDWENRFVDGNGCGYPSDKFDDDTTQSFKTGALLTEQAWRFGWHTLNAAHSVAFDTNTTQLQALVIDVDVENAEWSGTTQKAPFAFKIVTGDFSVFTECILTGSSSTCLAGLLCVDPTNLATWAYLGCTRESDVDMVRLWGSQGGVMVSVDSAETTASFLRLARQGDVFTGSYSADGVVWISLDTQTVTMDTVARIGLCVSCSPGEGGVIGAEFSQLKFLSGGVATCDRTLEACQSRGNAHRIFCFPGIPRI